MLLNISKKIAAVFVLLSGLSGLSAQTMKTDSVKDIDGNIYKTVILNTQEWMAENLVVTKLNDGTPIDLITESESWLNTNKPSYCFYDNDESKYKQVYGALYSYEAMNSKKLCPSGWHIPSDAEWQALSLYLDGLDTAKGKLNAIDTSYWKSPHAGTSNKSGFTAVPSGSRVYTGQFKDMGTWAAYWSSSVSKKGEAISRGIGPEDDKFSRTNCNFGDGRAVRCLKD